MVLIIGLILIGILLLVLEILVLPGFIAGVIGTIFLFISIIWMYKAHGDVAGHITLASTFVLTFIAIYGSLKTRAWKKYGLNDTIDGHVNEVGGLSIAEGDEGRTISALRPSGTVIIGEYKVEAQTSGEINEAGTKIIVTKILPNKVIVKIKVTEL